MKENEYAQTTYYHLIINGEEVLITSDLALLKTVLTDLHATEVMLEEEELDYMPSDIIAHYVRWNTGSVKLDKLTVKRADDADIRLALISEIKTRVEEALQEELDLNAIHWYLTKLEEEYRRT